jgi:hypothetical protein
LNTERWLLHAKAFCRASDIALFHNSYEIPDQPDVSHTLYMWKMHNYGNSEYACDAINLYSPSPFDESSVMKSTSAKTGKFQNITRYSRGRLALHRKDTVATKCAEDPFIGKSLTSSNPDLKDIAECIVMGEVELIVAISKIERALVAINETSGNAATFTNLRLCRDRVDNALTALRQMARLSRPADKIFSQPVMWSASTSS